ncbi:MAG: hypothetical protein HYU69_12135 [Bacteroidetes bacterium]|nr:hypothetical protein [Bacteroidota bacterium]
MSDSYSRITIIDKDKIGELRFPNTEVILSREGIAQRNSDMNRAMLLGNNYKGKVKIIFEDDENVKQVETTVWSYTDKRIILKKGLVIPIHRIHEIKV